MAHDRYRVVIKINGEYPDMFDDNPIKRARVQCVSMQVLLHAVISQSALRPVSRYTPLYHELASALDHIITEYLERGGNVHYLPGGPAHLAGDEDHESDGGENIEYVVEYTPILCDLIVEGTIEDGVPPPEGVRTQAFTIFSGPKSNSVVYTGGFETNKPSKARKALNALKEKKGKAGHAVKTVFKTVGDMIFLLKAKSRR